MHVIIFAGGTIQSGTAVDKALAQGELIIAADSGASTALDMGYTPDRVVGDFDSLTAEAQQRLRAAGSQFVPAPREKNETDTELALITALELGASQITFLGTLGGERFDHSIANMLLLASIETIPAYLVDGPARAWVLRGPGQTEVQGKAGDLLSLFPLAGSAIGVTTEELYYPLLDETLHFGRPRGISNVLLTTEARIFLHEGLLLVIHTAVA